MKALTNPSVLISFGFVMGAVVGLIAPDAIGYSTVSDKIWAFAGAGLGSVVVVLASFAVATLQIQVRQGEADENRRRQQLGARAILATDLSRIIEYNMDCAHAAMRGDRINRSVEQRDIVPCPKLDQDILLRLQRLIELLEGDEAGQVVDLMHCHQVQHARLSDELIWLNVPHQRQQPGVTRVLTKQNFEFTLRGTVELFLRAGNMFPYARLEQESILPPPFGKELVHSALRRLEVEDWLSDPERHDIVGSMTSLPPLGRGRRG